MRESSEILKQLFDKDIIAEGEGWIKLVSLWETIVGTDLFAHIKIKDLQKGTLILECDHPGWAQIFYMKKKAILSKLIKNGKKHYPNLKINTFRVICMNRNINNELKQNGDLIESFQQKVVKDEIEPPNEDFHKLLDRIEKLGE